MRTTPRRLALALLLSIAPATFSPLAFAQPAADPTLAAAHARFAEGVAFFDKGEYENARASFLQAYALHKHPAVLINLAQSSLRSGHSLDAARDFARYIHDSQSLTPGQRTEAEKGLAEARMKLGRIDVSAAPGTAVTIDGDLAGTDGSTTWDVEPGSHVVKGGVNTTTVNVAAGQTVAVRLGSGFAGPVPAITPVPPEPVTTPPPAAPTPPADATPATPPDGSTHHGWRGPESMIPVYLGATVSVAGFATAIVMAVFKGNATTAYNNEVTAITDAAILTSPTHTASGVCSNPTPSFQAGCQALTNDSNAVSTDATVANVGIAVGVIGAGFALGWYLLAPRAHVNDSVPTTSLRVEPILGHGTQGLTLGGTF